MSMASGGVGGGFASVFSSGPGTMTTKYLSHGDGTPEAPLSVPAAKQQTISRNKSKTCSNCAPYHESSSRGFVLARTRTVIFKTTSTLLRSASEAGSSLQRDPPTSSSAVCRAGIALRGFQVRGSSFTHAPQMNRKPFKRKVDPSK